ncbi:hypothetical protein [Ramlibacter alkalitolerans]|uniref:Uncharacterized protein n=1 Tax=Ramlibacter alkalitolerans TaxID=2039631 RepID=A0ABS1JNU6_9BURK|nr:hypothetical protein [Ramlibacter alkalitolerans]MBL0425923.1 hypothetical protein [Ramlibacter alkalitolerans]
MSDTRTTASILQRVPAILAVTANSYGLHLQADEARKPAAAGERRRTGRNKASGQDKPAAQR